MIPFLFQDFGSFSLSLFGILYRVDSLTLPLLFGLVGIYPVFYLLGIPLSLHLVYIAAFWGCLSVLWQFVEFSLLWSFLTVGGVVQVAFQGFLVWKLVSVFWWVELDLFLLERKEFSNNE